MCHLVVNKERINHWIKEDNIIKTKLFMFEFKIIYLLEKVPKSIQITFPFAYDVKSDNLIWLIP
jgi:hypothetical protein